MVLLLLPTYASEEPDTIYRRLGEWVVGTRW